MRLPLIYISEDLYVCTDLLWISWDQTKGDIAELSLASHLLGSHCLVGVMSFDTDLFKVHHPTQSVSLEACWL